MGSSEPHLGSDTVLVSVAILGAECAVFVVQCGLNLYRGHAHFVGINAKPLDGILESHHRYQRQTASFFTMVAVGEFAEISACTVIAAYQIAAPVWNQYGTFGTFTDFYSARIGQVTAILCLRLTLQVITRSTPLDPTLLTFSQPFLLSVNLFTFSIPTRPRVSCGIRNKLASEHALTL